MSVKLQICGNSASVLSCWCWQYNCD